MLSNQVHEMKGSQFPFGVLNIAHQEFKKIFVRKRYSLDNPEEHEKLISKIQKLKSISHKNTINLRSAQYNQNYVDLYYQYVPYSLEDSFNQNHQQTVKDMHRQFIQLAIFLAKNCIQTTFSASRCGVIINDSVSLLKYYLPVNEISIETDIKVLERSVQLFSVQSMHYLDTIYQQIMNSTINQTSSQHTQNDISSQRTFKNRPKLYPKIQKMRKDSQPSPSNFSRDRKFSTTPYSKLYNRKQSSLSKQWSQLSQMHKRHKQSTRVSKESFNTQKSIISHQNNTRRQTLTLKRYLSQQKIGQEQTKIEGLIERSKKAIDCLKKIKSTIDSYQQVFSVLKYVTR